ncbi:unnamed protein product [Rotaria socialis]|uniref:2OG-Fe dioxygenase family protein n=2 Tax=Rotaria socialis TaxID=392032 RepID=A0A821BYH3_9BILA|nr:unnamed protein product [Rotaria socialis]CAF4601581.1 unnamed protein product [Rotaria socialis]
MYRLGMDQSKNIAWGVRREPCVLTAKEGFKRHDAGLYRFFGEAQDWVMQNTTLQALMRFKYFMMKDTPSLPRPGCDSQRNWNTCGFFLRTRTTADLLGEPAAEGIHQDGVEFTMTTMFNSNNMRKDSAVSTLYNLNQEIGVQHHEADPNNIIEAVQHLNYLDTLLFVDNELSHSVTPVYQNNPRVEANRDMGVFFTRRMAKKGGGFSAEPFDSESSHPTLPAAFSTGSKFLS